MTWKEYMALAAAVLIGAAAVVAVGSVCDGVRAGQATLLTSEAQKDGVVLLAPYRVDLSKSAGEKKGSVLLLDRNGITLHTWVTEAPVLVAQLQKNGTLFVSMTPPTEHASYPGLGTTGLIQQLDWEGNVLWEYSDPLMTLDFEVMTDGSVAYLAWSEVPFSFASRVEGGFPTATTSMWGNDIVLVNREGQETWRWRMHEHMDPSQYQINDTVARQEFAHANSLRYVYETPVTKGPAYIMSVRHIDKAIVIDAQSGDIAWESPDGILSLQHDAMLLPNGNLLAFDNGFGRDGIAALLSRAVEVAVPSGETVWTYSGGTTMTAKAQFASSIMGGAQRLSNGNTLITLSTAGEVVEVTSEGTVAWKYVHESRDEEGEERILYRARFYEAEGTQWASRLALQRLSSALFCAL